MKFTKYPPKGEGKVLGLLKRLFVILEPQLVELLPHPTPRHFRYVRIGWAHRQDPALDVIQSASHTEILCGADQSQDSESTCQRLEIEIRIQIRSFLFRREKNSKLCHRVERGRLSTPACD